VTSSIWPNCNPGRHGRVAQVNLSKENYTSYYAGRETADDPILVACLYRSGTNDDPALIAANVHAMNVVALALFRAGHIPVLGEWFAGCAEDARTACVPPWCGQVPMGLGNTVRGGHVVFRRARCVEGA
jgi:hypothetical protein